MLEIKVPAVGESISEVTVGKYYKKEGDVVKMDDVIAEFESDKATFELNAPEAGTITKLFAGEGDTIAVGSVICTLDTAAVASSAPAPETSAPKKETKETTPVAKIESKTETKKEDKAKAPFMGLGGINWGWRIVILYSGFVLLILFLVYKTTTVNDDLVTTDYYAKELKFQ